MLTEVKTSNEPVIYRIYILASDGTETATQRLLHPGEVNAYCGTRTRLETDKQFIAKPLYWKE